MSGVSREIIITAIGGALGTLIAAWLTSLSESPLIKLILALLGIFVLCHVCLYKHYRAILDEGPRPKGRKAYDKLRQDLAEGGWPARLYARLLSRFLNTVDRVFGDAGMENQTLFPRAFGLSKPAALLDSSCL